jgi:hypothetical protein
MLSKPSSKEIWTKHFLTLGLYFFYWCSRSKADIESSAHQKMLPSAWWLAIPGLNFYWMWLYAEALEHVSYKRIKASDVFLLFVLGMSAWLIPASIPNFDFNLGSRGSTLPISWHTIIVILIVIGVVFLLLQIAGLAFFCSMVQKKINSLTSRQSVLANR